jgi:hypothetical protein
MFEKMSKKKKQNKDIETEPDNFFEVNPEEEDEDIYESEFFNSIKQFDKKNKKLKLIKVYELIGSPRLLSVKQIIRNALKNEYDKLIELLTLNNIFVHFKNDYSLSEKYSFIVEEIMEQEVENVKDTNLHINFIYEDFHPDLDNIEEEEI